MYLGLTFAKVTGAEPMNFILVLTGTATRSKCIPISVEPMSIPSCALISSTRTGFSKPLNAAVAPQSSAESLWLLR